MERRKSYINKITLFFICILVLLIFFSSTIYSFNLPSVTVGFPEAGEFIVTSVKGRGEVELSDKKSYFTDIAGIIEIYPKVGEFCREGQLLYKVEPQYDDISLELSRLQNEHNALEYRIEKAIADIDYYNQKIKDAELDISDNGPPDLTSYDAQLDTLSFRIINLEAELKVLETLYEINAATKAQLDDKENEIKALELQCSQILQQRENAQANYERNKELQAENAQKQLNVQLESYIKAVSDLEYQLKTLYIEKDNLLLRIADIEKPDSESFKVYAENDCVIGNVFSETGAYVRKYDKIMTAGVMNTECRIMMRMSDDVNYVVPGMYVDIDINSKQRYGIPGQIFTVSRESGVLTAEVRFPPPSDPEGLPYPSLRDLLNGVILYGGEIGELNLTSNSGPMECVVPISAIHRDAEANGYYIYEVVRKPGAFGYDYIARKKYVTIAMRSEYYAALSPIGYTFDYPIIFNSDRVINEGDRVKLADGADYIETR